MLSPSAVPMDPIESYQVTMNTAGKHLPVIPSTSNQSVISEAIVEQRRTHHNLLSMPTEICVLIYQYTFEDEAFIVDVPVQAPLQLRYGGQLRVISNEQKRSLPGVLHLCRKVRAEALPLYFETIHPLFCNHKSSCTTSANSRTLLVTCQETLRGWPLDSLPSRSSNADIGDCGTTMPVKRTPALAHQGCSYASRCGRASSENLAPLGRIRQGVLAALQTS